MIKDVLTIPAMSYEGKYVADLRYPPNPDGNNRDIQKARERPIYYFDMMTSSCVPLPRLRVKYIYMIYCLPEINNFCIYSHKKEMDIMRKSQEK